MEIRRSKKLLLLSFGLVTLFGFLLLFSGCQFLSSFNDPLSAKNLALVASSIADYKDDSAVAESSKLEVDDVNGKGLVIAKSLTTTTRVVTRNDGTVVTITEVLDDKNTLDDKSDDTVTVTREYKAWNGAVRQDKIVRPLKPSADWNCWDADNLCTQSNITISSFINGVKVSEGSETLIWRRDGDSVSIYKIIKETHRIGRNGGINKVEIVIDENGLQHKTRYRIRVTNDGEVVVRSFSYEEFVGEDGNVYTKIVRDDGSYGIVVQKKNPRIVEYYNAEGKLKVRVTEERDLESGVLEVTKEFYNENGELVKTRKINFTYKFLGDEVIITKKFDSGRSVTIKVTEADDGYTVNRNGYVYVVKFEEGNINIYNEASELIASVSFGEDGNAIVRYSGSGSEERVNL